MASEFQVGRATRQMRGAWNEVKEAAQFAADIPGSVVDLIPGVDIGSLGRMGERVRGLWDFVTSPMQTIKAGAQAHEAAYVRALEAGDYRGAGQMHGEVEGGISAGAVMSYAGAGVSSLARGWQLGRMAHGRPKIVVEEGNGGSALGAEPDAAIGLDPLPKGVDPYQLKLFPDEVYSRRQHYGSTPTAKQRASVPPGMEFDHDPILVRHYYEGFGEGRMPGYNLTQQERTTAAASPSSGRAATPAEQRRQGAEAARYSKEQKRKWGLDQ